MESGITSAENPSNWSLLISELDKYSNATVEIQKSSFFSIAWVSDACSSLFKYSNRDYFEDSFKKICAIFDAGAAPEDLSSQVKLIKESVKRVFPDKTDPLQKFQRLMHLAHFEEKYRQKLAQFLQEEIISEAPHLSTYQWFEGHLLLKKYCSHEELSQVEEVESAFYKSAFRAHYGIPCDQVSRSSTLELMLTGGSLVKMITTQLSETVREKYYNINNFLKGKGEYSKNPRLACLIYAHLAQAGDPSALKCLTRLAQDHMQDQVLRPSEVEKQKNQLSGESDEVDKKLERSGKEFGLFGKISETISTIDGTNTYSANFLGKPSFSRTGIEYLHIFSRDAGIVKLVYETLGELSKQNELALQEMKDIKRDLKKMIKYNSTIDDFLFSLRILSELKIKSESQTLKMISTYHNAYLNSFTQFGIGLRRDISPTPLIRLADEVYRITDNRDCFASILALADRYESNDDTLFSQNLEHAEEIRTFVRERLGGLSGD